MKTEASLEQALVGVAGGVAAAASLVCGIVLGLRRLGGAFQSPPESAAVLAATAAGVGLVLASDAACRAAGREEQAVGWPLAARAGLVMTLAAIAFPPVQGTVVDRLTLASSLLLAGAAVAGPFVARRRTLGRAAGRRADFQPRPSAALPPAPSPLPPAELAPRREDSPPPLACPGHLVQRFERYTAGGNDCLRGTLSLAVPAGARTAHGHVGFCPPFAHTPSVEVSTEYDGVEAVVAAAEILPWGVRIECRLDEPAEEAFEISVDVLAQAPA